MYNVFTDFHHASLLQSFILLFEKRLGGKVYRPIGTEWFENGFWKIYDHPATVAQFLGIGGATPDGTPPLNEVDSVGARIGENGKRISIYNCHDIDSDGVNKAITYEGFMNMKFDIVIASIPAHVEPFARLCELHPNKPKLIYQIGNQWNFDGSLPVKNIMSSATVNGVTSGLNVIQYHQEFDLDIFWPDTRVYHGPNIYSFVNCFNVEQMFAYDWTLFQEVERLMPNWTFRSYGGQCRDGAAHGAQQLADKMRESLFIWHTKKHGDGYGHVLFNSAAVGRPIITKKSDYAGKLGEDLMIDGKTCINIDGLSPGDIVEKIKHYSDPRLYEYMRAMVVENFREHVNFDREEQELRQFLNNLL